MKPYKIVLIISLSFLFLNACLKPESNFSEDGKLSFSVDTLSFDTIFVGIGTTTLNFKVYNDNNLPIKINEIYLAENADNFRLNIDGNAENQVSDYILAANDSLFIFVELTINTELDQLLEQDSIVFELENHSQDIDLIAFGQNVHLINGNDSSGYINTQTWTADKPYLIYNSMLVEENQVLNIEAGTQIYFHQDSRMYVLGSLIAKGTVDEPILFTGDRLEEWYDEAPGQWRGIWLMAGSKNNWIEWAEIRNGIEGLIVDTLANENPTLTLLNTKIENMNSFGLLARGAKIFAANNLFANCGQITVGLILGGNYEFYHCTMANYWPFFPRPTPALYLNNYYGDENNNIQIRPLIKAQFTNCIIYGGLENELGLDSFPIENAFNYQFENCVIRVDKDEITSLNALNSLINPSFQFKNISEANYELDTLSIAKDAGNKDILTQFPFILNTDLNGNTRNSENIPDIGAYERVDIIL